MNSNRILLNHLNRLVETQFRSYRFGKRVTQNSFYVSPEWFDKKEKQENKTFKDNILNPDGVKVGQNKIFNEEKNRQKGLISKFTKIEVNLEKPFPDSEPYTLMMNCNLSTPFDCASHIHRSLRERSALAVVNGSQYWDMHRPLTESCNLKLLHFKHEDTLEVNLAFWRTCSMLLGSVVGQAFKEEYNPKIISLPISELKGGSFICDIEIDNLPDWKPNDHEIRSLTSVLWDKISKGDIIERLEVNVDVAQKLFEDNPHRLSYIENSGQQKFTIYRIGQHIELSDGPMISDINQIGSIYLTAIHPLKNTNGLRYYRLQGIAMPKQLSVNPFIFSLLKNRSKNLNPYGIR